MTNAASLPVPAAPIAGVPIPEQEVSGFYIALLIAPAVIMTGAEALWCGVGLGWSLAPILGFGETARMMAEIAFGAGGVWLTVLLARSAFQAERSLILEARRKKLPLPGSDDSIGAHDSNAP